MNLAPILKQRFFDSNGLPLAGGFLYSYQAGTTTPLATFSNSTGTSNANPVVLDSSGYADVWIDQTLAYKFVLQDANSNVLWTVDNVSFPLGIASWNSNTSYSQGNIVQDSSGQGLLYVSLINNNQNNALTSVSSWRSLGGNIRSLSVNTSLVVTDEFVRSNSTSGSLTHTLPACATTPVGKRITIKDVGSGGNTTSVKGAGTDNIDGANTYATALRQYESAEFENNGTSWDVRFYSLPDGVVSTAKLANLAVSTAKLADASVTQAKRAALTYQLSSSCGTNSVSATSPTDVTNLSVTITTTGRPVLFGLVPDQSGNICQLGVSTASHRGFLHFVRDGNDLNAIEIYSDASNLNAPAGIFFFDVPTAASHTYKVQANVDSGAVVTFNYFKLVAYEL